jgi:hypothetical protein
LRLKALLKVAWILSVAKCKCKPALLATFFMLNVPSRRSRTDEQIKEVQEKMEKKKGEIIQLQAGAQMAGPSAAQGKAPAKA